MAAPTKGPAAARAGPNRRPHQIAVLRDSLLLYARQSWHADHGDLCLSRSRRQMDESRK
jgi:hypothetical protein